MTEQKQDARDYILEGEGWIQRLERAEKMAKKSNSSESLVVDFFVTAVQGYTATSVQYTMGATILKVVRPIVRCLPFENVGNVAKGLGNLFLALGHYLLAFPGAAEHRPMQFKAYKPIGAAQKDVMDTVDALVTLEEQALERVKYRYSKREQGQEQES